MLFIYLKSPKLAPVCLVGGTQSPFFLRRGFGGLRVQLYTLRMLFDLSFIHFVAAYITLATKCLGKQPRTMILLVYLDGGISSDLIGFGVGLLL